MKMNTNNSLEGLLQTLMSNVSEAILKNAVAKVPFFKGAISEEFMQEAVITAEGNVFLHHLVGRNIPATPIMFDELEEIYHAAKAQAEKENGPIKNSSRLDKSLARHEANNWPHPLISGTYELPSGEFTAYVSREEKTIDLRNAALGTLLATISFDDISRLAGVAFPSVLPDGQNGCPVPNEEKEEYIFRANLIIAPDGNMCTCSELLNYRDFGHFPGLRSVPLNFSTNIQEAPDGKMAVYAAYFEEIDTAGTIKNPSISVQAVIDEIKSNYPDDGPYKIGVAFIEKQ